MHQLTRSWPALAALGAALLYAAVGAGAVSNAPEGPAGGVSIVVGGLWIVLALTQAVFGMLCLHRGRMPATRTALAVFVAPLLLWVAMLAAGLGAQPSAHQHGAQITQLAETPWSLQPPALENAQLPLTPLVLASLLSVGVAFSCALHLRAVARTTAAHPRNSRATHEVRAAERADKPLGGVFLTGLVLGSLALSAIVTPGLAATDAGRFAVDHGTHSIGAPAE